MCITSQPQTPDWPVRQGIRQGKRSGGPVLESAAAYGIFPRHNPTAEGGFRRRVALYSKVTLTLGHPINCLHSNCRTLPQDV